MITRRAFSYDDPSLVDNLWTWVLDPEDGQHKIRFCFADKEAFNNLHCILKLVSVMRIIQRIRAPYGICKINLLTGCQTVE